MEDILEELVGEIWDEHDESDEDFRKLSDSVFRVNASMEIKDFCAFFGIRIETELSSLSGWIMERLDRIPAAGDSFVYEGLRITVASLEHHRPSIVEVELCAADA